MSITKAILLTIALISVFALIQVGLLLPLKSLNSNYPVIAKILVELSSWLGFLFSYLIIFYYFGRKELRKLKVPTVKSLSFPVIFYILLIAIGLELFDRPFWDITKIIDLYNEKDFLVDYPGYYEYDIFIIYQIVSAILIAPIFEELFFRKFLLGSLLKRYNSLIGLLVSSLCFALIHIETPNNLIPTFTFGVVSGIVFIKTKRIMYSVLLHLLMNSFWLILLLIGKSYYQWIYSLNFNFIYWVIPLLGGVLVIIATRKIPTIRNL